MHFETRKKNESELSKNNKSQYYALAHQKQRFIYTFMYYMYVKFKIYLEKDASNKMHKMLVVNVKSKSNQFIVCVFNDYRT